MPGATRSIGWRGAAKQRRRRGAGVVVGVVLSLGLAALLVPWAAGAPAPGRPVACPPNELQNVPANPWVQAQTELAPPAPTALRLCRYSGELARSRVLKKPALLTGLVNALDTLPAIPPGVYNCPADDGSQILVLLAYPGGQQVTVAVDPAGCRWVYNGDLARTADGVTDAAGAQALITALQKLTAFATGDARVSGRVWMCGPPTPKRCHAQKAVVVVAFDRRGDTVAIEPVSTRQARYSFALPPARYTFEAIYAGRWHGWRTVTLTAGDTRHAKVVVPVP